MEMDVIDEIKLTNESAIVKYLEEGGIEQFS